MSQPVPRSPLSAVFLLHVALEAPIVVQTFLSPTSLPFMQMTNTTLVLLKLYAAISAATCLASVLLFPLPEFLPGKRALAIAFCVYHSIASTILFQAPRFIPHTFGAWFEAMKIIPENVWGTLHGLLGLAMVVWWQLTLPYAAAYRNGA
ncbi:hypothetical protein PAXRUDRAFT_826878 [Paxillus rubicundulus Ve08.2h10]|uniref:Uncharacterized protein n=1 Tax=Paxillus rubicundulus Ve08.2h10 TaxID=930991 RepID=A0A0D0DZ00_9AGAM|nr:hypothetical protein PAXRUDRAFT_826878 [Paxillus rubicundulus Ve08.2h10]